jgi:putative PIN family toxin of toxin-antitoxin system
MKVFLDTNVWLSATIFSGLCEELVLQCTEKGWLISSALVQTEAHQVLSRKFPQAPHAAALFDTVWQAAVLIPDLAEPVDDNDRRLIAAAAAGAADLFVTGDKRVLGWRAVKRAHGVMQIVSPRTAWAVLFAGTGTA